MKNKIIKYFNRNTIENTWGINVSTIGNQVIPQNSNYPLSNHPESYLFTPENGRVLNEYQLIYIVNGNGTFKSKSCRQQTIKSGTIILLFPNEWHTYRPNTGTGWEEYWVGFQGSYMDNLVRNGIYSPQKPLYNIGLSHSIINLFDDLFYNAIEEKRFFDQILSSLVIYLLGLVNFKFENLQFKDSFAITKINEARTLMKQNIEENLSPQEIANNIIVSYSWFRKMFKTYVGISPAQYQYNLKIIRAKELLEFTETSVAEIAEKLKFTNSSKFSTFFKSKTGYSPLEYRKDRILKINT
jgi:AraC-like DNA-binding protein